MHASLVLDVKALDPSARTITGIASTATVDRQGHSLDPLGATFTNPLPLLLHHDRERPVGSVTLTATPTALTFTASLPVVPEPGGLRDRIDETWQALQAGLLTKASIGLRILEAGAQRLKNGIVRLVKYEVCEVSLTTMPVNPEAVVLTVKALEADRYAPDVAPKENPMTTAEQILACETRRATHVARMTTLLEEESLDDAKQKEYDGLQAEVNDLDARIPRLKVLEKTLAVTATPVAPILGTGLAGPAPSPIGRLRSNLPPGTAFVRYVKAMAAGRGDSYRSIEYAKRWADQTPEVELLVRAAVAAGTTTDSTWAGPLKPTLTHLASEFVELLRPATIIGRIPGLRRVPFNVSVPKQTAGGTYSWVGEGAPKPVTSLAFTTVTLPMYKVAGILVFTKELAMSSEPSAEQTFRDEMIAGIAQFMDAQFIDPAVTLTAGVRPASITNGVTGIAATADPLADISTLLNSFITAGIPISGVVLLMSESNAFLLSAQRSTVGEPIFPNVSVGGGTISGIPVITSQAAGTNIIAIVPRYVLYADTGGVEIDVSQEASLQMDSAPSAAPDATTVFTSLWQQNYIGLRAERFAAWIKAHASAVNMITGTAYTP